MWIKKFILRLFVIFLVVVFSYAENVVKIAIISMSDLQSNILPERVKIGEKIIKAGGFPKLKTLKKLYEKEGFHTFLVSTGDDLFGPFYKIFKGVPEVEGMNISGFDIVAPGNHEFDNGEDFYFKAIEKAKFSIVSSNLRTGKRIIKKYMIKNVSGVKIGFFGLITPELKKVCSAKEIEVEEDIFKVSKDMVKELKNRGSKIIIALTHIGKELDKELSKRVSGIDFIIGGHDHEYIFKEVKNPDGKYTIITQAGSKGIKAGILKIYIKDGKIIDYKWELRLLDESVKDDEEVKARMVEFMKLYKEKVRGKIGKTLENLDGKVLTVRRKESNLGNLIADSIREWNGGGIVFINGGSIRGDKLYPEGEITYETVLSILPFQNEIYRLKLKGSFIKNILEVSASSIKVEGDGCPKAFRAQSGGFLQVSGIEFVIDLNEKPFCGVYTKDGKIKRVIYSGNRIKRVYVLENGKKERLNYNKIYTVLLNSWTFSGGDGYYMFKDFKGQYVNTTMIDNDILIDYIKKHSPISPQADGRIRIINKK